MRSLQEVAHTASHSPIKEPALLRQQLPDTASAMELDEAAWHAAPAYKQHAQLLELLSGLQADLGGLMQALPLPRAASVHGRAGPEALGSRQGEGPGRAAFADAAHVCATLAGAAAGSVQHYYSTARHLLTMPDAAISMQVPQQGWPVWGVDCETPLERLWTPHMASLHGTSRRQAGAAAELAQGAAAQLYKLTAQAAVLVAASTASAAELAQAKELVKQGQARLRSLELELVRHPNALALKAQVRVHWIHAMR